MINNSILTNKTNSNNFPSTQHQNLLFKIDKTQISGTLSQFELEKEFKLESKNVMKSIHTQKIKNTKDKTLAEFNYKRLNSLLCNNLLVGKWNENIIA